MIVDSGHVRFHTSIVYTTTASSRVTSTAQHLAPLQDQALQIMTTNLTTTLFNTSTLTITIQEVVAASRAPTLSVEQLVTPSNRKKES